MSNFAVKKNHVPETKTVEGTAKRNIIRRGGGGGGGKGRKDAAGKTIDDGSLYTDPYALDENDPNYDSEEEVRPNIPGTAPLHREDIARSKFTLTSYKKKIQPIINEFLTSFDIEGVAVSLQV
jgi:hypothetical protein